MPWPRSLWYSVDQFDDAWYRATIANGRPAKGMPTWGTVLSPEQIGDLVALIAAWRDGLDRSNFRSDLAASDAIFAFVELVPKQPGFALVVDRDRRSLRV